MKIALLIAALFGFKYTRWDSPEAVAHAVRSGAQKHGLAPELVAAIVYQESKGDPHAYRDEPAFYNRYIAHLSRKTLPGHVPRGLPTLVSEKRARATSYGLMQILGETARENGFTGRYLSQLHDPEINVELGCKYFKSLLNKKNQDVRAALLGYNGGGNPNYPSDVLNHIETGAYKTILLEA